MGKEFKPSQEQVQKVAKVLGLKDPIWAELACEVTMVVDKGNAAYGDSTVRSAKILDILWGGVSGLKGRFHDLRCMVSILDKLSRIVTDKDAFGESPWRDVAGYALLAYREDLKRNKERER